MRGIAEDRERQCWWKMTDGTQESVVEGATGWQWQWGCIFLVADLGEVFHFEGKEMRRS
ncbi:hypothetical protein C8T65DRAFT_657590 [Cerioporus squamosus]|nr:hypothetical protein C8T65DRAFT_657590 [Cerioporus squamosus]